MMKEIYKGLGILMKYKNDSNIECSNFNFHVADYSETFKKMTDKDKKIMKELGWYKDSFYEGYAWTH